MTRTYYSVCWLAALLASSAPARAATLNVSPNGSGAYPTIQAAIAAANPGDTVLLSDGDYTGVGNHDIDFSGKNITVTSVDGASATIIDCQSLGRGFIFQSGETQQAVLNGVTIENGAEGGSQTTPTATGGAMLISGASPTVSNCLFDGNSASGYTQAGASGESTAADGVGGPAYGGAVYIGTGSPTFENCAFVGNTASGGSGYGGYSQDGTAAGGGQGGDGDGGAVFVNGGAPTFQDCLFLSDITNGGQGVAGGGGNSIQYTGMNGYGGNGQGGAIYYSGGQLTVTGCTFSGSVVNGGYAFGSNDSGNGFGGGGYGGAIAASISGTNPSAISDSTFSGNSAVGGMAEAAPQEFTPGSANGGAIGASSGSFEIDDCIFSGNVVEPMDTYGSGGAISIGDGGMLANCTFNNNSAVSPVGDNQGEAVNCGALDVVNTILWGDGYAGEVSGSPTITYTDDADGVTGTGDIDSDPMFASTLALSAGSPCIEAGTTGSGIPATDIYGNPWGGAPDMGAIKYGGTNPNAPAKFVMNAALTAGPTQTIPVTVTARDGSGNVLTGFTGVMSVTTTDSAATFPSTILLTNGTATFDVTFNTAGSQTITATDSLNSSLTATANVVVTSLTITKIAVTPTSVIGGAVLSGTVTISGAAPAGGVPVALSVSPSSLATVPASVMVPSGSTSATFSVTTNPVAATTSGSVAGTVDAHSVSAAFTVVAPVLTSLGISPSTVQGGANSQGVVYLTGPAPAGGITVSLTSSSPSATVPASVTVPAGSKTAPFVIGTSSVGSATAVPITATEGSISKTNTVHLTPPEVTALSIYPYAATGGVLNPVGTVTIAYAAPAGGYTVSLSSSNTSAATVPATVTIDAGQVSGAFPVTTEPVTSVTAMHIGASAGGASVSANLTVEPPALTSLGVSPSHIDGGQTSTGTVYLTAPAPAGGVVVTLTSLSKSVTVPASVTIAAGSKSQSFTIVTSSVSSTLELGLEATYASVTKSNDIYLAPPAMKSVTFSPTVVKGGAASTGTVTLNVPAPTGGLSVTLASSNTSVATVPASVAVAAGATTATFTATTLAVPANTTVSITATAPSGAASGTLGVTH